eukprot:TRINITY_DN7827_c1_g1_i1.p1 TRINITY_DN7827_c1_g1~~TRINITY_DN7827_c1_g1_i1.p1  ORF type:complete len:269 (+),score=58.59 TRINITY_DN7827_c1_g1_i1:74-808(+)
MRAAVLASAAAAAAGLPSYPPAQPFTNYTQSEVDAALRRGADWRSAAGPVQGQGALGSASPIAVAEAVAASWNLRHKQMLELSEQQIIDCAGDQGRLGPVYELSYVAACGGLESATQYPAGAQKCGFEPSKIAAKVANYTVIPAGAEGQLAAYLAASRGWDSARTEAAQGRTTRKAASPPPRVPRSRRRAARARPSAPSWSGWMPPRGRPTPRALSASAPSMLLTTPHSSSGWAPTPRRATTGW